MKSPHLFNSAMKSPHLFNLAMKSPHLFKAMNRRANSMGR
jgi:hypothetical protein